MINKVNLTTEQLMMVRDEVDKKRKNKTVLFWIWFFLGGFGGHRFYMGNIGYAVAMLFFNWLTLGIWALIDIFVSWKKVDEINDLIEEEAIVKVMALSKQA
ncbi:TM2 domain-containing protein [Priestia aryabhattai]|uniref:TM2 domain-containing protein n=1 Tax=Priestia aryabhattai TaxID=412384 RepID=UPI0015F368D2|nr:TM2 domain-containing protein [Priestia aryabhattai]